MTDNAPVPPPPPGNGSAVPPPPPGAPVPPQQQPTASPTGYAQPPAPGSGGPEGPVEGSRSFIVTWLLAWILGYFGADRFYLGKVGTGILKLITAGGFGLWAIIDLILVLTGNQRSKDGRPLEGYEQNKVIAIVVTLVVWIFGLGIGGFSAIGGN